MAKAKNKKKNMAELTSNYEVFVKDKEVNTNGKKDFDEVLKKAIVITKQHGSK